MPFIHFNLLNSSVYTLYILIYLSLLMIVHVDTVLRYILKKRELTQRCVEFCL